LTALDQITSAFRPVSLQELDDRASLLHRVDVKYLVSWDTFAALSERLRDDHQMLEIDGRRMFRYESFYFDTLDLRCYHEHERGTLPRFKARTRLYADSGRCVFEIKLKLSGDVTDKRQIDYRPEERETISPKAARFLAESLEECGIDPPARLEPSLRTAFRRLTLAPQNAPDRLTCDVELELQRGEGRARLDPSFVIIESKSETGVSAADRVLSDLGVEPVPLSKYRVGIELLAQPETTERLGVDRYFTMEPAGIEPATSALQRRRSAN
jgi:VTC domain-containing protein